MSDASSARAGGNDVAVARGDRGDRVELLGDGRGVGVGGLLVCGAAEERECQTTAAAAGLGERGRRQLGFLREQEDDCALFARV